MLYSLTKPLAKIALSAYFRKINISNQERIPAGKPVILAVNHPTAFIDPCFLACWLEPPLNFLARGDFYVNNPAIRKLYNYYHIVPVFRIDDTGYGGLKNNYDTFDKCYENLRKNQPVLILAEGRCVHEKRLRPLMKGTARIVFGTLERHPDLDLHVVPVGVNYTDPDAFRSDVMIDFGEPIRVQDYLETHRNNPAKAVNALTADLRTRLAERVIHIEQPEDDAYVEQLLTLRRNNRPVRLFPSFSTDPQPLFGEKKLVDEINRLSADAKTALKAKAAKYFGELKKAKVTDRGLMDHTSYSFGSALLLGLGWIPYMAGYMLNILPILLGNRLAKKLAKTVEFRASIAIFASMAFYLIYWLILLVTAFIIGKVWLIAITVGIPLLGQYPHSDTVLDADDILDIPAQRVLLAPAQHPQCHL
ncbi:MAG: 1-acyl-sn-glycerol-3-phosphate acyltransferase, partial [Bacteroidetes bacterium]|nr:1-acyl-sn-glycerol-3-phosphate acyltransferase [Bacteroidota bacterium]